MPELSEKISELLAYDGIEVAEVHQGKEVQYQPPKDAYFIVVPKDAVPHQETAKERLEAWIPGTQHYEILVRAPETR